ncbi:MAG: hypothetical protein NVSMB25_02480 [Thermoleophilaceae bacterium]
MVAILAAALIVGCGASGPARVVDSTPCSALNRTSDLGPLSAYVASKGWKRGSVLQDTITGDVSEACGHEPSKLVGSEYGREHLVRHCKPGSDYCSEF